jgi:hypothetical protein
MSNVTIPTNSGIDSWILCIQDDALAMGIFPHKSHVKVPNLGVLAGKTFKEMWLSSAMLVTSRFVVTSGPH